MSGQEQEIQTEIDKLTKINLSAQESAAQESAAAELERTLNRVVELDSGSHAQAGVAAAELLQPSRGSGPKSDAADLDQFLKVGLNRLQEALCEGSRPEPIPESAPSAESDSLGDDPELIADFVNEAREHLASIETNLLALEKNPELADAVHSVFRSFHTIKGLTGFLGLKPINIVAHETETILDHARERRISISARLIDTALKSADYVRVALDALSAKPPRVAMQELDSNDSLLREIASMANSSEAAPPASASVFAPLPKPEVGCVEAAIEAQSSPDQIGESPSEATPEQKKPEPDGKKLDATVVRVDTAKLEYLVEMVGELVIAQSLINFGPNFETGEGTGTNAVLSRNFAHLGRVTAEIQKTALSMRMVPISRLYDKMARLVRDLARKSKKRIELRRIGDHVELDRNIVDEITDPFVHMIRNSIDHGIEDTDARAASGKDAIAYVTLEAFHQAGSIILRMSDDGRGLRPDKILQKAIQKGLIAADANLDEQSIYKLIFEPGFSTAERVTDISGRGVGMDVVRRQIEKLRGTIEIASAPGLGCAFTLKLPLTLAMVDGLIVQSGGERYVLPIYSTREMFHLTADKIFTIENKAEMVLLRGALLPVVRLESFFAGSNRRCSGNPGQQNISGEIGIVVDGRTRQFCLIVDRMLGKQEVVIKTLGPQFRHVNGVAGGAILGDGRVGLILDVHGIDGGDMREI